MISSKSQSTRSIDRVEKAWIRKFQNSKWSADLKHLRFESQGGFLEEFSRVRLVAKQNRYTSDIKKTSMGFLDSEQK